MCGICGVIKKNISLEDLDIVRQMNDKLIHRGPDDDGFFYDDKVALAMRRLSIIDIAGGKQPLFNEDKTIVLVANCEIYNYIELRDDLRNRGHRFSTNSDCETIIYAYEEYGEKFFEKLRGMFAFCLYDIKKKLVYLARDRMAEKPLYYNYENGRFIFSSEMKSLINFINKPEIDLESLDFFLSCQYVIEPSTIVRQIRKLEAAHFLIFNINDCSLRTKKYWDPFKIDIIEHNQEQRIRESLEDVMKIIIRSDVPIGVSLSGGLDSSIIAIMANKYSSNKIHAFTIGYPGQPDNDERQKAKSLASILSIPWHEIELTTESLVKDFPEMIFDMDDLIGDIAAYGYYQVAKEARRYNIPVLLNGMGSDEIFWGYAWFNMVVKNAKRKQSIPVFLREIFGGEKHYFTKYSHYQRPNNIFKNIYTKKFKKEIPISFLENNPLHYCHMSEIQLGLIVELFRLWLFPNCTSLGDRLSMASSIELRSPFLDVRVVETALGIARGNSEEYKLPFKDRLKNSVRNLVPKEILNRSKKGFQPPVFEWQKNIINNFKDYIFSGYIVNQGLFNKKNTQKLVNKTNDLNFLYRVIVFEIWYKEYLEKVI
jgi:asparagine synthase (glutamine-hydrolysing)